MTLKRICACIFAALIASQLFFTAVFAAEAPRVVTLYNESNGLPTGEANEVIQTRDGYIWIGSYGGLIRYDGTSFRNFSIEGAIPSSSIRALHEDSSGRLWIGTNDAGVFYMEGGEIVAVGGTADNGFLCIRDFDEGADGTIYVASNSGLAYISDGALVPMSGEHTTGRTVYSVSVDSRGRVWGALNAGVCVVTDGRTELCTYDSADFFDMTKNPVDGAAISTDNGIIPIYCCGRDTGGNIWLGSATNVLVKLSFASDSLDPADFESEYFVTDGVSTHNSIKTAPDGGIIVCGNIGACVISPDGSTIGFSEEERAASLNSGCVDYEGSVWLASTAYGIIKYTRGYFGTPGKEVLSGISLNAVAKQGGYFCAATDSGLLAFDENWQPVTDAFTQLFDGVRVRCVLSDSKGRIWAASYATHDSVACYNPATGELETYNGLLSNSARTLYELSDGGIAVGTQEGLNIIRDGEISESYGADDGLTPASVLCTVETPDGAILVGSDGGGIYEIRDGEVINHGFDEGLEDGVVLRILPDGGGYFISAGSSLYYYDSAGFRKIDITKGAGSIFDFYSVGGSLWILQNNGIMKFDRDALLKGEEVIPREYGFEHGLSGSLNANTWNWVDPATGELYIATRSGVSVFGFEDVAEVMPKIIVNSLYVDGAELINPESAELPKDANRITIDFSALTYTGTTDIDMKYWLDGFDDSITVLTDDNTGRVSYTNLPGGEYTFNIVVYEPGNPDNSASCSISIVKEKKLYEHAGFVIATVILGLAAAAGIVALLASFKIKSMKRRQREYRSIVEQSLQTFARSIDAKDRYTNGHSLRVAEYSRELSKRVGLSTAEQENVYYIALLHDIGKIGIPDSVLNKPGKLTDEERQIIQNHPKIGGEILKEFTAIEGIADGAKYHHERIDGNGYNAGLKGDEIPLIARIIGVADTYDAMSSDRPYRKALPSEHIVEELKRVSGTQLDPKIVPHMLAMIEEGLAPIDVGRQRTADDLGSHYHM